MKNIITPQAAASLVLLRTMPDGPRILMGKRAGKHIFMPEKWVFPGGRIDPADHAMVVARDLPDAVAADLELGAPSPDAGGFARAAALAAIRETFEETGLILGAPAPPSLAADLPDSWLEFVRMGYLPDLSQLQYIGRAITPETGYTRRFDARFLMADAAALPSVDPVDSDELHDLDWFSLAQCRAHDLAPVTHWIIDRVDMILHGAEPTIPTPPDIWRP